jgi:acetyltransferase-like isoleucine patch superfamily enzyme
MAEGLVARLRTKLLRRKGAPLSEKIRAARVWLVSSVLARVWLRDCDEVGVDTKTYGRPHIENRGRIVIGAGVQLASTWAPLELVTGPNGVLEIADGAFLNYGTLVSAQLRVRIGANAMIGNYSIIADTEIPGIGEPAGAPLVEPCPVEIGDGAWLAARVTVLPGTRIGPRAVIAAGSVVSGDIPAGVIAGGIPARILREAAPDVGSAPQQADIPETEH